MTAPTALGTTAVVRSRGVWWLRSFRLMTRRDLVSLRVELAVIVIFQTMMGAGAAFIYGFVLGDVDATRVTYIVTGAPTLALIPVGFAFLPNVIGNTKAEGSYDFTWSLPVPRSAAAAASLCVFTAVSLPGAVLSLGVASWRYDIELSPSLLLVPAIALTALMAASVGYALGHAVPDPRVTNLVTNVTLFFVLMFSPIAFPIEQFPDWFAALHQVLPFHHMATVIRSGLTEGLVEAATRSYVVLAGWTIVAWTIAFRVVARRP